jgi:hypothetical protein
MVGSAGIAAWIAQVLFWALLLIGFGSGELKPTGVAVFVGLWLIGRFGLLLVPSGAVLLTPYLAVVDIALVFAVFKGDVRLS